MTRKDSVPRRRFATLIVDVRFVQLAVLAAVEIAAAVFAAVSALHLIDELIFPATGPAKKLGIHNGTYGRRPPGLARKFQSRLRVNESSFEARALPIRLKD